VPAAVAYLVVAGLFSLLTPAWENNDEADHVRYVEYIVAHGGPPHIGLQHGIESHQPPLYYYVEAGWQELLGIASFTPKLDPPGGPPLPPTARVFEVSHAYTAVQRDNAHTVHLLRLISLGCGLATVLAAVWTGWLLTARRRYAVGVGLTVALWPKFVVVTSAVTNMALAIALCACAVPVLLTWRRTHGLRWAALGGVLLGAAASTSDAALPLAGLGLALLCAGSVPRRDWRSAGLAVGLFAAVSGWWFIHNAVVYGDPLATAAANGYLASDPGLAGLIRQPATLSPAVVWSGLKILAHSTWYDGGWNQLQLPHWLDYLVLMLAAASLAASARVRLRGGLVIVTSAVASVVAWLLILRDTTQAEGRYILVGILAWAALLVAGADRLTSVRAQIGAFVWPAIFFGLDIYVLATWLVPYGQF
jgi:hypothetical protein